MGCVIETWTLSLRWSIEFSFSGTLVEGNFKLGTRWDAHNGVDGDANGG